MKLDHPSDWSIANERMIAHEGKILEKRQR
jgi:hypothetical protein